MIHVPVEWEEIEAVPWGVIAAGREALRSADLRAGSKFSDSHRIDQSRFSYHSSSPTDTTRSCHCYLLVICL
jgi:hypothetical protein